MALRAQPQAQDPSLEDSRQEAESLEGRKAAAQTEVLAIAQDKKRIEEDKTNVITALDADILDKQEQSRRATDAHAKLMATHAAQRTEAEAATAAARDALHSAEKDRDNLHQVCAVLSDEKATLEASIATLSAQEGQLKASVADLMREKEIDEKRITALRGEIVAVEAKLASSTTAHSKMQSDTAAERHAHSVLLSTKEGKQKELAALELTLGEKTKTVSDLQNGIAELETKKSQLEAECSKRDDESNARLGAATRLETRVDGKLTQLKEAEKEFTIDHLSRIGYKPIGS